MITVTGSLTSPINGTLEGVEFRITSELSSGDTVKTAIAAYTTGVNGAYTFPLVYGRHTLEVRIDDTFEVVGDCVVGSSTPTPINIAELIKYTTPVVPPTILPDVPNWSILFDAVRTHPDTFKQENREQIVEGTAKTLELEGVSTNTVIEAELVETTESYEAANTVSRKQGLAYSDQNNQKATITTNEEAVEGNTSKTSKAIYRNSNGSVEVLEGKEVSTANVVLKESHTIEDGSEGGTALKTDALTSGTSYNNHTKQVNNATTDSSVTTLRFPSKR